MGNIVDCRKTIKKSWSSFWVILRNYKKKKIWMHWRIFGDFFDKFLILENIPKIFKKFSKLFRWIPVCFFRYFNEILWKFWRNFDLDIDFIVTRPLVAHLSLYTRLKPACDKKIGIMGLVYIFNQWAFNCRAKGPRFKPRRPLDF